MTHDLEALLREHGNDYVAIARIMGLSRNVVRCRAQRLRAKQARQPVVPRDDRVVESGLTSAPFTLDDLFRLFQLEPSEWEVIECTPNIWQIGAKHPETGEILTAPLFQIKARLKPVAPPALMVLGQQILGDIREDAKLWPRVRPKVEPRSGEPCALVLDIFDLHLGKLAWAEEVGEHYDAKIAAQVAEDAVRDLLDQARGYALEEIIVPIGNDFFNADNLVGTTTGGTRQDVDTRFHLMFRRGRALATWMLRTCEAVAPVVVPVVPGNHDRQTSFTLGEVLDATFAANPRVTIDNTAAPQKYHLYGRNLLGFTHGDEEKPAELPQLMATDQPALWAESTYREFHIGHFHHGKEKAPFIVDDKTGVTVRWIRSLSGSDRWHTGKGYRGRRGAEAFVLRRSGGIRAHLFTEPTAAAA